jgi:hypothetical protein
MSESPEARAADFPPDDQQKHTLAALLFDGPGTDACVLLVHNSSTGEGAR